MRARPPALPDSLTVELLAPCGMNCGVCIGHLRDRRPCPGCNDQDDSAKPHHCVACRIKLCEHLAEDPDASCVDCPEFPCARLRQLDKRYRLKYRMSMIENLKEVQQDGPETFVERERVRWTCGHCGALVSVHRAECPGCGESAENSYGAGLTRTSTATTTPGDAPGRSEKKGSG
ncbi:MAG: DUF3795 domain-containing protein [Actinobacteria bacterium]|nr:DUF3795 domain-containing protein [Actinomycetota bacterium]